MKTILHVDINSCYASIEVALNPQWKGLPLAVCGSVENRHGIVLAKSQEAKVMGVKTGEAVWQARNKCPNLLVVPPHYEEYLKYSRIVRGIYYEYTNQVEPFGLDECWLDVTGSEHLFGNGETIGHAIRERIKRELKITVSVGVSFNKVFAKLGSDLKKPDALTYIPYDNFRDIVWPLDVDEMIGIGRATKEKLRLMSVRTLGDLAMADPKILKCKLGINGVDLWNKANGRDYSPVMDSAYRSPIKSIGRGITCREDLVSSTEVKHVFQELSLDVAKRLRDNGMKARGVQISVRNCDLFIAQHQGSLPYATAGSAAMVDVAMELFNKKYPKCGKIRSLTIRAIDLVGDKVGVQKDMFGNYEDFSKREKVDDAIYSIRKRFGKDSVTFASLIGDIKMPTDRTDIVTLPGGVERMGVI